MIRKARAQALLIRQGHLLLARHYDLTIEEHYWCLPGGAVEAGELPEQAAVREVKEETNLDVRLVRLLSEQHFARVTQGYASSYTYLAEVTAGELQLGIDPEQIDWEIKFLQDVQWIPIDGEYLERLRCFFADGLRSILRTYEF